MLGIEDHGDDFLLQEPQIDLKIVVVTADKL
jgi:hypothetical protein